MDEKPPDVTIGSVLENIFYSLEPIKVFLTAGTYLVGMFFAFRSIYQFREYGELRTMMSSQTSLKKPVVNLLIAVALVYWPEFFDRMIETVYGYSASGVREVIGYPTGATQFDQIMTVTAALIQVIGFVAFVRGWVLLARIAEQGAQPGSLGKATMHILAGLLAVNIYGTWEIVKSLMGVT